VDESSRVLVLDGDPALTATVVEAAAAVGFETRAEKDVDRFMEAIDAWRPSHVLLDLNLDDMDGIEVVLHLAARGFSGAVIIISHLDRRVLEAARLSGLAHGLSVAGLLRPVEARRLGELLTDAGALAYGPVPAAALDAPPASPGVGADELARALRLGDLRVVYQPKVDCRTGEVVALEGLARWHDARRGEIMPDVFVPLAEVSGHIDRLTDMVFEEALAWFGGHFAGTTLQLCLNLSARSLHDIALVDRIERLCIEASVDPSQLVLELTETSSVPDQTIARDVLTRFRIRGMSVGLDDFGSGHSSLVQLARQPFSELKIDRSFVMTATRSADSRSIIGAVVALGRSLGMRVTAEGVEDAATYDAMTDLDCDLLQGNYLGRPMEGDDVLEYLDARAPLLRSTKSPRS
jgi:EAL domain-containing protein (putative c-di-GMP-specific phosphodiesterase class I)/CheY-like chemotaxis protein